MKIFRARVTWKDSFQEILDCWQERGFCEVVSSNDRFSWILNNKDILLYEHDRIEGDLPDFDLGLFANEFYQSPKSKPWIYWPRFPRKVEFFIKTNSSKVYQDRNIESVFIGFAENIIQWQNRTKQDWSKSVQRFEFSSKLPHSPYPYTNEQYLEILSNCKFGLCLEGYGSKCQRDIEYMALGVVPIFTWPTFNHYHNPLIEGIHYFYANNPAEVRTKIINCSEQQWADMSNSCRQWYQKNCSIDGAWITTLNILYG